MLKKYKYSMAAALLCLNACSSLANGTFKVQNDSGKDIVIALQYQEGGIWERRAVKSGATFSPNRRPLALRWVVTLTTSKPYYDSNPDWGPSKIIGYYQDTSYEIKEIQLFFSENSNDKISIKDTTAFLNDKPIAATKIDLGKYLKNYKEVLRILDKAKMEKS